MPFSPQASEQGQCPICCAVVARGEMFCGACGSKLDDTPALEIRSLNYLLSELSRWEEEARVNGEQASGLRAAYEKRREELRTQLAEGRRRAKPPEPRREAPPTPPPSPASGSAPESPGPRPQAPPNFPPREAPPARRRPLLETLADPYTIRLLLYSGAAMLVVGVVIWLRDILYLKLQEPLVQAALLIISTIGVTVAGWLTILRTRLRLTGRALTLAGSLLVPVNFWFLVRSGLIESSGRAWLVCAFCAVLYGLTAAFLGERPYVYLACVAAIFTSWTLIYRVEPEAPGLYALALMGSSILFLHLSHLLRARAGDGGRAGGTTPPPPPLSHDLWGPPLVRVALAGAALCLLFYTPLRLGSQPLAGGFLRLRASHYDSGIAILLFAAGAYAAWFTGRYIFERKRIHFYTTSALCLFWAEFLAVDGFNLSASAELSLLAATSLAVALAARSVKDEDYSAALHRAALIAGVVLAPVAFAVLSDAAALTLAHSAVLALLAAAYAILSTPRLCDELTGAALAYASAVLATLAFLVALASFDLNSASSFYAACALWPFALYGVAQLAARTKREAQLRVPFARIADAEFALLIFYAVVVAVDLGREADRRFIGAENLRVGTLCVLAGGAVYGALRVWLGRSFFGALIIPVSLLIAALILLGLASGWFALAATLTLFPVFFTMSRRAPALNAGWLAQGSGTAADAVLTLASVASMVQALFHLRVGDPELLAPAVTLGAVALLSFGASLTVKGVARVRYFRVGLVTLILAFALAALRAGYDPLGDAEIYTSPTAVLLLAVAYLFARRHRDEYAGDTGLLLWVGSLLLSGPLLLHALQYRLFLGVPAPGRDLLTLCASLALIIFGVAGRLRAPVLVGAASLMLELAALATTSVDWLQIPLKVYLISTGALILIVWGLLEFRREQVLAMRRRFDERRAAARERFGEWK